MIIDELLILYSVTKLFDISGQNAKRTRDDQVYFSALCP